MTDVLLLLLMVSFAAGVEFYIHLYSSTLVAENRTIGTLQL